MATTEPCALCGAEIAEGGACANPKCKAAWKSFHGPTERPEQSRPAPRDGERAAAD